jgi:hypothetical protein
MNDGDDHTPVSRWYMRAQYPLLMPPPPYVNLRAQWTTPLSFLAALSWLLQVEATQELQTRVHLGRRSAPRYTLTVFSPHNTPRGMAVFHAPVYSIRT